VNCLPVATNGEHDRFFGYDPLGQVKNPADGAFVLKRNAWNLLAEVSEADSNDLVGAYASDDLFRRTTRALADGPVLHRYYNSQWRQLEVHKDAETDPLEVYYWGKRPGYRDDLARRDRDANGEATLDGTLFCLMDFYDRIAVIDGSGMVQERYEYSDFGVPTVTAPVYSVRSASSFPEVPPSKRTTA